MARRSRAEQSQNVLAAGQSPDMQVLEASIRAMQEAMAQSAAASQGAPDEDEDIIWNDPKVDVPHPNELGAKVWVTSPGRFFIPTEPTTLLLVGHKLRTGDAVKNVQYIKAGVKRGTSIVYLMVSHKDEPSARECKHTEKGIEINLATLLVPNNLQVMPGFKELYPATLVTSGKMANVLTVDMSKYEKRQPIPRSRSQAKSKSHGGETSSAPSEPTN